VCALVTTPDSSVICWGSIHTANFGKNIVSKFVLSRGEGSTSIERPRGITCGNAHVCVIASSGQAECWNLPRRLQPSVISEGKSSLGHNEDDDNEEPRDVTASLVATRVVSPRYCSKAMQLYRDTGSVDAVSLSISACKRQSAFMSSRPRTQGTVESRTFARPVNEGASFLVRSAPLDILQPASLLGTLLADHSSGNIGASSIPDGV